MLDGRLQGHSSTPLWRPSTDPAQQVKNLCTCIVVCYLQKCSPLECYINTKAILMRRDLTNMLWLLHRFHYLLHQGLSWLLSIQPLIHGVISEPCHLALVQLAGSLLNVFDHLHLPHITQRNINHIASDNMQCQLSSLRGKEGQGSRMQPCLLKSA